MSSVILTTKLFIPPHRPGQVLRSRLMQKLSDSLRLGCKLSLVSAPAGFGKTTLVTEWIETLRASSAPPRIAWLSVDAGDNDVALFISYLAAALETCCPGVGSATRLLLENVPLPSVDALLLPMVNDLARLAEPLVLVLDDYHTLQLPVIHEAMGFLIERMPHHMQVVITTRQDPLLPLARWRARGLMTDIRLRDLRFTEEEAAEFLNQTMGLSLRAEDISALETRTEGWIAGLQLAAVSLFQSSEDCQGSGLSGFVKEFTGNDRYVMDYLIDEVLCRQSETVQTFLLHTAVLERFSASLCAAMLAGANAAGESREQETPESILAYLDRANLFLIPLDSRREWYRYHHLFAELLQDRLKVTHGVEHVRELKRRASRWFDTNGFAEEAIQYAIASADWSLCAELITRHGPGHMQRGEIMTLLRWLRALPESIVRETVWLSYLYGSVLTSTGKLELGEQFLKLAEQGFQNDPERLGSTLVYASYNACFRGDFAEEIALSRRALTLIPAENLWMRGTAAVSLGIGLCHIGDPQGCEAAMHEALAVGRRSNIMRTCIMALTYLGRMAVLRLDLEQAQSYFRQASQYQVNGLAYASVDIALFDLAQMKYEQNALDEAAHLVEQGLEANQRSGSSEMRAYAFRQAARLYQLQGKHDLAQEKLREAIRLADDYNLSPLTLSLNAACQVEMALWTGNLHEAEQAAPRVVNSLGLYPFIFYPETARVHLLLVQGRKTEALQLLEPALERAERPGWEYPRLQVRLLQALAQTSPEKAHALLREALVLAEPAGAMRCFLDLGQPLCALLQELRPQLKPSESAYADRVLSAFRGEQAHEPMQTSSQEKHPAQTGLHAQPTPEDGKKMPPLVEALSEREREVLRLIADGLSNAEIAQRLYLSPNTLKAHTQNIYAKLDVHSRVQVLNRARELGLIA